MYSGLTLTKHSGKMMGTHQKIDRVARRHLARMLEDDSVFPAARTIIKFEGRNGPDGLKNKSPGRNEPSYAFQPFDDSDTSLPDLIQSHHDQLVEALKTGNRERVAFEAAWLAHAIVDGLTPAHHHPYEQALLEHSERNELQARTTRLKKLLIHDGTPWERLRNNWKLWGPRGLLVSHGLFELGIAALFKPLSFKTAIPSIDDIRKVNLIGPVEWFRRSAREVAVLDIYNIYRNRGWIPKLAWQAGHKLGPIIVQSVTLSWYTALAEAGIIPGYESHSGSLKRPNLPEPGRA